MLTKSECLYDDRVVPQCEPLQPIEIESNIEETNDLPPPIFLYFFNKKQKLLMEVEPNSLAKRPLKLNFFN